MNQLNGRKDKEFNVIGNVVGVDICDVDLIIPSNVHNIFEGRHIDYVVHCAAVTDTMSIEKDPFKSFEANVLAVRYIAKECAKRKIKMVFISSDYVLSEKSLAVDEERIEFPINQYGLQKLLAEKEAQLEFARRPKDLLILRSSWMFGNSTKSFVEKFLANLAKTNGPYVEVASDAYGIPTHVEVVLQSIMNAIRHKSYGLANCQPWSEPTSRAMWALCIKRAFAERVAKVIIGKLDKTGAFQEVFSHLDKIDVKFASSKDMNLGMSHPGYVDGWLGINAKLQSAISKDVDRSWINWTHKYIEMNFSRIFKSYYETYKKSYNEELMQYNIENYGKSMAQMHDEAIAKIEKQVDEEGPHECDRTKMLTVQKLVDYLKTKDPDACILAWEPNSYAYIEQLPGLPSPEICTVAEDKSHTIENLKQWYKNSDDADAKIEQEIRLSYRYAKDNDIVIRFN